VACHIVVQERSRHTAERGEGRDVAAQEALHAVVERKAGVERARPRQHEDEADERAARVADLQRAEVSPVDLSLLAGQRAEAEIRLRPRRGADDADVPAHREDAARVAAPMEHRVQARRAQPRMLRERVGEKRFVRIEDGGAHRLERARAPEAFAPDGTADGVGMDAELGGDRADRPVLGIVQPTDPRGDRGVDHRAGRRRRSRCTSANDPSPTPGSGSTGTASWRTHATVIRAGRVTSSKVSSQRGVAQKAPGPTAAMATWHGRPVHSVSASASVSTARGWRGPCGKRALSSVVAPSATNTRVVSGPGTIPRYSGSLIRRLLATGDITVAACDLVHAGDRGAVGRVMRHFRRAARAIALLAGRVLAPAGPTLLIAGARGVQRRPPHRRRAPAAAVPLAPIAVRAEQEHLRAWHPSTHHKP
jgi:hypothetical protein